METCHKFDATSIVCQRCLSTQELLMFENEMLRVKAAGGDVALICYDITSLRKINHAYGRPIGDAVLAAVAGYIAETTRGTVYRIEGDLYCAVIHDCTLSRAVILAQQLEQRFAKSWKLGVDGLKTSLFISISLAVVEYDPTLCDGLYQDLFERALEVSRKSKTVTVFDKNTEHMSREHIRLQMDLKSCILEGMEGFDVAFQPIADPRSSTWKGLETLCRWNRPGYGAVSPFTFIKEAEEMGYIHNIGTWILETAVKTCKDLGLDRLDSFFISVNVSALQIIRHDFSEVILDILRRHDYPSEKLLLEITESNEFVIDDDTRGTIDHLREQGVLFALDDFGTGYSGFNSLKSMPVKFLKTERDFIFNIEQDTYLQYFLFILSEVSHSNGMKLIAEGVETKSQLDCVMRNGADLIQGYFFGRPIGKAELKECLHYFYQPSDDMRYETGDYIDFPRWIGSKEAYTITPSLFYLLSSCMDLLLNADSMDESVNAILARVGSHFNVKRAYVFLSEGDGHVFSNRFEWCADGVESQIELLQGIDGSLDGFYDILVKNRVYITTSQSQLPNNLQQRLEEGGQEGSVQSMVVMPMTRKDSVIGFVGFDDDRPRQWTPEEMVLLYHLCLLVLIVLGKRDLFEDDSVQA